MAIDLTNTKGLSASTDLDIILSELPVSMILDIIKEQIEDVGSNTVNYMEVMVDRHAVVLEDCDDDPDLKSRVYEDMTDFYTKVIELIAEKFAMSLNYDDNDPFAVQELCKVLYAIFVLGYVKFASKFLYKYIKAHKDGEEIQQYVGEMIKSKDVTTTRFKKGVKFKNKAIIAIISCINDITRSLLEGGGFTNEEFLEYAISPTTLYGHKMREYIEDGVIESNFVEEWFVNILSNEDTVDNITNKVKSKIYKKYSTPQKEQ